VSIMAGLGKQVGPLPLGVWLLVGGGGLFIAYRKSNAPAAAVDPLAGPSIPAGGTDPQISAWDGAPVVLSPVVQVAPPRIEINNVLPVVAPVAVVAPKPLPVPVAAPRVAPKPVAKPAPKPAPKPVAKPVRRYTIRSGDTLWAISIRYYVNPLKWSTIYAANKTVIEAAARAHGRASSSGGHWIYPGSVLVIP